MANPRFLVPLAIGFALTVSLARAAAYEPAQTPAVREFGGEVEAIKGPLAGAKVTATFSESTADPPDAANIDDGKALRSEVLATGADGRYRLEIPADLVANPRLRVSLAFSHPEYLGRSIGPVPVDDFSGRKIETGTAYWAHRQSAQRAIAHTRLRQGKPLAGRVLTADGAPVAGASVSTRTKYQPYSWKFHSPDDYSASNFAVTDDQGRFATVTDTQATLTVELPGHAPLLISDLKEYPGADDPERTFLMPPGFRVRGRVLAVDGEPIAGAIVLATLDTKWDEFDMPLPLRRNCAADRFGNFELPPLPAGRYRFSVNTRVADLDKIDEFNVHHDVPAVAMADVVLSEARNLGSDGGPLDLELRALETATITARVEFPDGPGANADRQVDLAVNGKMNGQNWSGISARADENGIARLIVPRGVHEVVIETGLARHRRTEDGPEEIGTALLLDTVTDDVSGLVVIRPRLATLKVKLKLPRELSRQTADLKAHVHINAGHFREGYQPNRPTPQHVGLQGAMQTNDDQYRGRALPNEELVLRVTKSVKGMETVLHEERLTLEPGEERLREITIAAEKP